MAYTIAKSVQFPSMCPNLFDPPAEKSMRPIRGFLLHGPPGTGKTAIAMAVKQECSRYPDRKVSFFEVSMAALLDGNLDNNVTKLFDAASRLQPSMVFVDEIDRLLVATRQHDSAERTFMTLMAGSVALASVYVLACTNKPETVCEELRRPGRLEVFFEVKLPSAEERQSWLTVASDGWKIARSHFKELSEDYNTEGFSASELTALCGNAKLRAFERLNKCTEKHDSTMWTGLTLEKLEITSDDLNEALAEMKSRRPQPYQPTYY